MNKIRDLRFGKKEKPDVIDPAAYSSDGYLIHQGRLDGVRYGRKTTKETGCGWIACYNFLKYMGKPEDPLKVAYDLEGLLLWGGRIGSHPFALWWYLYRKGFHFRVAFTRWGMERVIRRSCEQGEISSAGSDGQKKVAGILAYIHKKGSHYTTFLASEEDWMTAEETVPHGNRKNAEIPLRFLNAVYGVQNHRLTAKEFFQKYVRFPLCFVIVVR